MTRVTGPYILLLNFVLCTVIALVLWLVVPAIGQFGFWRIFVHSQAIGNCISLLSILSFSLFCDSRYDTAWVRPLIITVATATGIYLGLHIAHWLLGIPGNPLDFFGGREELTATLVTAVIASGGFNWYLSNRERVVRLQLTASEEHRRAENTRHALLRAQVEPHMLFNTLANLRALINTDTDKALNMLDRLDSFLRTTLQASRSATCLLSQEFSLLEDYLEIMKVRLGDRLHYELTLPPECRDLAVPTLVLQPVVENAIKHGIEAAIDGGEVHVSASLAGDALQLTVTDTGVGMAPSKYKSVPHSSEPSSGFGLDNLRERLKHGYGPNASLKIEPNDNHSQSGTIVSIHIPVTGSLRSVPESSLAQNAL